MTNKTLTERQATDKQLWNLLFQMAKFADRQDSKVVSEKTNHVVVSNLTAYFQQKTELMATDQYKLARVRAFNNNVLADCLAEACRIYQLDDSNSIAIKTDSIKPNKKVLKHNKTERHISYANLHLINTIQVIRDSDEKAEAAVGHLRYAFINTDTNADELDAKVDADMRTDSLIIQQDTPNFILDDRTQPESDFIIELNADQYAKAVKKVVKATAEFYEAKPKYNDFEVHVFYIDGKFMVGRSDAGIVEVVESEVLQPQTDFVYGYTKSDKLTADFMVASFNTGHLLPCLEMFGKGNVRLTTHNKPALKPHVLASTDDSFASIECAVMPRRMDFENASMTDRPSELMKMKTDASNLVERKTQ